jgi:zinc transport system ATP-binding protein
VREIVRLGLESRKGDRKRRTVEESVDRAIERVGMMDLQNRRIGELSGGQQQRVMIARTIVHQPRILFLDEPTTGVDAETQDRFFEMLDDLNEKERITIVLVTHETGIVDRHVRQVACLNRRLYYHGTHEEFCRTSAFRKMLEEGHHVISHRH